MNNYKKNKEIFISLLVCIISVVIGTATENTLIGIVVLITGILNSYYGSIGKKVNFIIGVINNLALAYIAFKNNNYGLVIFNLLFFMPINIKGYFEWGKNLNDDFVNNRSLGLKKGFFTIVLSVIIGLVISYILNLIPGERLTYLDAFTNVISFIAAILFTLRYNESWLLYLINNVLDLILWIINFYNNGFNSLMVLLMSIMYLVINIYALFKWRCKDE